MMIRTLTLVLIASVSFASFALDHALMRPAAFEETLNRFPSPYAVIEQFQRIVPYNQGQYSNQECKSVDKMSAPVIGTIDPLQLGPLEQTPGELFYQYYIDCVRKLVQEGFQSHEKVGMNLKEILGEDLLKEIVLTNDACKVQKDYCNDEKVFASIASLIFTYNAWSKIDSSVTKKIVDRLLLYLVGPPVILRAKGYFGENNVFGRDLPSQDALSNMLIAMASELKSPSGEEAKFTDVYGEIAITLRLGPALQN